jgi:hypothetical protein
MRKLRVVSREFQLLIDDLLQSTSWLQPLATRGEVFRREYVMPDTQNWPVLLEAMRELNSDEKTLQCIIATYKLQLTLSQHRDEDPDHPIFAHRVRLTQLVAWGMRSHPRCRLIQYDGLDVLCMLKCRVQDGNDTLTAYTIGSIAVAMHNNLSDPKLLRIAMQTLYGSTCEVDSMFSDTGGAVMADQSPSEPQHIDKLTLVQPAEYFVPNLVVRVMEEHMQAKELMCMCVMVLWHYMNLMTAVQASCGRCTEDVPGRSPTLLVRAMTLHKFDVLAAKAVLSTCMQRYARDGNNSYLRNDCMLVFQNLIPPDFLAEVFCLHRGLPQGTYI